jgi:hypothetical protein
MKSQQYRRPSCRNRLRRLRIRFEVSDGNLAAAFRRHPVDPGGRNAVEIAFDFGY